MVMNKMFIFMLFLFPLGLLCFWFLFTSDDTLFKYFFWTGFIIGALYYLFIAYAMCVSESVPQQWYWLLVAVPVLMIFFGICLTPIFTLLYFIVRLLKILLF